MNPQSIVPRHPLRGVLPAAGILMLFLLCGVSGAAPNTAADAASAPPSPSHPGAACSGGPTIDGILLDECVVESFTVGGQNRSVTVWYTKNQTTATRDVDGTTVTLEHWINTDAQAQDVADWAREAWARYFEIFGRDPYHTGCNNNINVQLEEGVGWAGVAYWASSGNCRIGIDAPMVRNGGGQGVVYHEVQHYMQYAFDDGCYDYIYDHYDSGSAAGVAEFVEGYADVAADAVDATVDANMYAGAGYNPAQNMYDKSYGNLYNKYFVEQLGALWLPTEPHFHMDAVRSHYELCDTRDTLYVLPELIPSLRPGETEASFFLDFFAANWAKNWADVTTQPELVYWDDDVTPFADIALAQNASLSSGAQTWNGQTTPALWAGRYYQVRPQTGCPFVTAQVQGAPGSVLGINLMAADTSAPFKVERSAWIGAGFARTFPGAGVYDRLVASVNAFDHNYNYAVSFTCLSPTLNLLEPRQVRPVQVGAPASPIAFLTRFTVKDGATPVLGVTEAMITADAEGSAATIIPGTLQQVGEEYWMLLLAPIKPAGTTFVDLKVCVNSTVCDTETDALLYVAPGNTDFALVFDASGSMATEDITGEGTRLENAKKAGTVLADLLRIGDRIVVTSFSAFNNPVNCGLPYGAGDCVLDIQTHLNRMDIDNLNDLPTVRTGINAITARAWTPIGAGLVDGKNKLQAAPYSLNPKHIILLSDGEENVHPLYSEVSTELIDSGVVIDTIAFSSEADEALMALIASQTGGIYRYVPTTEGTMMSGAVSAQATAEIQAQAEALLAQGAPAELIEHTLSALYPGPLALDDAYDYFETKGQNAERLLHVNYINVEENAWRTTSQYVEEGVNEARFVVASKQGEWGCATVREVEVAKPGLRPIWYELESGGLPAGWEVRRSTYDEVLIVTNPEPGRWQIRTRYYRTICNAGTEQPAGTSAANFFDVMVNGSSTTDIHLEGRFLNPIANNQGKMGDRVPIVATLFDRTGPFEMEGTVWTDYGMYALVEMPGSAQLVLLWDDGLHNDGQVGDGIFGGMFARTQLSGTYNVRIYAYWTNPGDSQQAVREWNGSFWIRGLEGFDLDGDLLPDYWEELYGLDPSGDDGGGDPDGDGVSNYDELVNGTNPNDPDSDDGGEQDGSEIANGRNPNDPVDDLVDPVMHLQVRPFNAMLRLEWVPDPVHTAVNLYLSTDPENLGPSSAIASSGVYTITGLTNGTTYYVTLEGINGTAKSDFSETVAATPNEDTFPPSGVVRINDGAQETSIPHVQLSLSATDEPLDGLAFPSSASGGPLAARYNMPSGVVEMRISNSPDMSGATWQAYDTQIAWTLAGTAPGMRVVYVQFRDEDGNISPVVSDSILLTEALVLYMPFVNR